MNKYFLILFILIELLLWGCAGGYGSKRLSEANYAPYPDDHPVMLYCSWCDFWTLYKNLSYLPNGWFKQNISEWNQYFIKETPPNKKYVVIGTAWVGAKFEQRYGWDKIAEPKDVAEKFKILARKNGADAVIDVHFEGTYLKSTYPGGSSTSVPSSQELVGALIRYIE